ncbi:TPA: phage tail protein, partial [Klebsiella pneumoniae]
VGDGNGSVQEPGTEADGLINEIFRARLNRLVIADQAENVIRAEMIIPPQVGGFWVREAALYNEEGECLAVANVPPSYKPLLSQGAGRLHAVNLWIAVIDTASVQLTTDYSVVLATVDEVNRLKS